MGMQIGGKRRILVRPERGWFKGKVRNRRKEGGKEVRKDGCHPCLFPLPTGRASETLKAP